MTHNEEINISYFIDELEKEELNYSVYESDILELLTEEPLNNDLTLCKILNYSENFTIKDLLLICKYYGMTKEIKNNKCNKNEIIHFIVDFESDPVNYDIVNKRLNMWFYVNQLKNDKFMKKYVLL